MPTGPLAMLPNSATIAKGHCEYRKATMVQSTQTWLRRSRIWDRPTGPLEMLPKSVTTWKGRCE
eukprot:6092083-Amphidinium_carterae.1